MRKTQNNIETNRMDVFGVRRPTKQTQPKAIHWKVIDLDLDHAFAEIVTVATIMEGTVTHDFLGYAELVPTPFLDIGIRMAMSEGWITESSEGNSPPGIRQVILLSWQIWLRSQISIHDAAGEICFDLIESVMNDNPMRVFAKHDALIGIGGPCTAKTWPVVERMLASHPAVLVGGMRERKSSNSTNFYRNIIEGTEVRRNDSY